MTTFAWIVSIFSEPVSLCHGAASVRLSVRPSGVRPSGVRPSGVNFFLSGARSQTWMNGSHSYWEQLCPVIGPWCTSCYFLSQSNMAANMADFDLGQGGSFQTTFSVLNSLTWSCLSMQKHCLLWSIEPENVIFKCQSKMADRRQITGFPILNI